MPHKNFYKFEAKDNFELGLQMGQRFSEAAKRTIKTVEESPNWPMKVSRAKEFLKFNQKFFPQYIDELRGYAKSAGVDFSDLYTISLEDETNDTPEEKCTTLITNNGGLLAHNEDWDNGSEEKICVVEKSIGQLKILELFYLNTLGGNSVSINSNGFITAINSMASTDTVIGVSKNFVARWLSETEDPDKDIEKLKALPRGQGHNINILERDGALWNIEYTSHRLVSSRPALPFVHANHHLSELGKYEANTNSTATFERYQFAKEKIKPEMSVKETAELMNDESLGEIKSLMNERTIAKVIIDLPKNTAKIWIAREPKLGFVDYNLKNIFLNL